MDHTAQDVPLLARELGIDPLPLGVAHALEDDLLGRLRRDAPEFLGRQLLLELDVELGVGIEGLGFSQTDLRPRIGDVGDDPLAPVDADGAGLAVDVHAHAVGRARALLGRGEKGRL